MTRPAEPPPPDLPGLVRILHAWADANLPSWQEGFLEIHLGRGRPFVLPFVRTGTPAPPPPPSEPRRPG